jgi:thymidine phosphorylase
LPKAPIEHAVKAENNGYVTGISTRDIGLAVVAIGGGRTNPDDVIDHAVGITGLLPIGAEAVKGEPLAIVHARSRISAEKAEREIRAAYAIGSTKPAADKAIVRRIAPRD